MSNQINPKLYQLPSLTKLLQIGTNQFEIVIDRKSRIIMKDGEAILTKVNNNKGICTGCKSKFKDICTRLQQDKAVLGESEY